MLVLMADIFPTGYFAASRFLKNISQQDRDEFTTVVIGCGPVGICAITCALTMVKTVYAIDSVPERLKEAEKIGAIPINLNDNPVEKIKAASGGRGADVVMEIVGHADAFMLAFDMIRPWGQISSIGVHTEQIPLNGLLCYGKNVTMSFGRLVSLTKPEPGQQEFYELTVSLGVVGTLLGPSLGFLAFINSGVFGFPFFCHATTALVRSGFAYEMTPKVCFGLWI